jgi:hypothetical protein
MNGPGLIGRGVAEFDMQGVGDAPRAQRSSGEISSSEHARSSGITHDGPLALTMRFTCSANSRRLAPLLPPGVACGIKGAIEARYSDSGSLLAWRERQSSRFTRDT